MPDRDAQRRKRRQLHEVRRIAREELGIDRLRPLQERVIHDVLDGHDVLAIMPTGAGKSAIYQVSALITDGPTIVVSPLIALQQDQVQSIDEQSDAGATVLNSTLTNGERADVLERLRSGDIEFLLLAPEQFDTDDALDALRASRPSLFVVDEAHCISQWGREFRPDYLRLGRVVDELGHPRTLALTATASPPVRDEIIWRLHLREPRVIVSGFDRPNIWLVVEKPPDDRRKQEALVDSVLTTVFPGIVYAATRRHAEEVVEALNDEGVRTGLYHAGLSKSQRAHAQDAFMDGEIDVMVATNAFGMGIDKPDVRFVYHYDVPESIDAYYQEIGRAGRDGEPAEALLFYRPEDLGLRRYFAASGETSLAHVHEVLDVIAEERRGVTQAALEQRVDQSRASIERIVAELERTGAVKIRGERIVASFEDANSVADAVVEMMQQRRQFEQSRVDMMRAYAESRDCRRKHLLTYFGEAFDGRCEYCDNCEAQDVPRADQGGADRPFELQARVMHLRWGDGTVQRYDGDRVTVLFDRVGYKTLSVPTVLEQGLLRPAS